MKVRVTLKDPDTLIDALEDEKRKLAKQLVAERGLTEHGAKAEAEARLERVSDLADLYFEYGEYVTIELDSDANTAIVVPRKG